MRRYRVAYLVTHPIQYQAPLLRLIAADPEIELEVFFCSDWSVGEFWDPAFGRRIRWDADLLDGYSHQFLPALGSRARFTFWRPFSYGLARRLRAGRFDALWIHGYGRAYHLWAMLVARRLGIKVLVRDEASEISSNRGPAKRLLKRIFFRLLRQICDGYLAIGAVNRAYYLAHGIPAERIFLMPYAVDNDAFRARAAGTDRAALRCALDLPAGRLVILFAAKMVLRKRPDLLLEAYARLEESESGRPALLFVGDGESRPAVEARAEALGLGEVRFLGFKSQAELPAYYALADVFVLPSDLEPYAVVVLEAMNAGCALVLSDRVGSAADTVREGENGYVFETGDCEALCGALRHLLADPERCRAMGRRSLEIVAHWSFREDIAGLKAALAFLLPEAATGDDF